MNGNEKKLRALLSSSPLTENVELIYRKKSPSTNGEAKAAPLGVTRDSLYVAERQSAGRGRLGRSFLSKKGGLYMTLRFECCLPASEATKITIYASVAVARATERLAPVNLGIKWVNDIILEERKLSGILTEGVADADGNISVAVLGIGINVKNKLAKEIKGIATTLKEHGKAPSLPDLAYEIVKEIYSMKDLPFTAIIDEYRRRSVVIGKEVRVIKKNVPEYAALVLGINEDGELILELPTKERELLSTGEVSVRL